MNVLGLMQAAGFGAIVVLFVVVLLVIFVLASAVRIVNEYERGVIFWLAAGLILAKSQSRKPWLFCEDFLRVPEVWPVGGTVV